MCVSLALPPLQPLAPILCEAILCANLLATAELLQVNMLDTAQALKCRACHHPDYVNFHDRNPDG